MDRCPITRNEEIVLRHLLDISLETGHEMMVSMCRTDDGDIYPKFMVAGDETNIYLGKYCLQDPEGCSRPELRQYLWSPYQRQDLVQCERGDTMLYNVHTHPHHDEAVPSGLDMEFAKRFKIPRMCIISRTGKMACRDRDGSGCEVV